MKIEAPVGSSVSGAWESNTHRPEVVPRLLNKTRHPVCAALHGICGGVGAKNCRSHFILQYSPPGDMGPRNSAPPRRGGGHPGPCTWQRTDWCYPPPSPSPPLVLPQEGGGITWSIKKNFLRLTVLLYG